MPELRREAWVQDPALSTVSWVAASCIFERIHTLSPFGLILADL